MPNPIQTTIRATIEAFCKEFMRNPYLCYTEHGMHARFYMLIYNALNEEERYFPLPTLPNQKVCVVQKEYPTAHKFWKPRRQHWDIAIIKNPPEPLPGGEPLYDYLRLAAAIEFSLNYTVVHLQDDRDRLADIGANMDKGYLVHLYRLTRPGQQFSRRDLSTDSEQLCKRSDVEELVQGKSVEAFFGSWYGDNSGRSELWHIDHDVSTPITWA